MTKNYKTTAMLGTVLTLVRAAQGRSVAYNKYRNV